jgi:ribosomal protein S18 acetylase RimI-like enzyme
MKQITGRDHLARLLSDFSARGCLTNNYNLLESYHKYLNEGKIFEVTKGSNACLLVRKENYFQLYYYINDPDDLIEIDRKPPVSMEILYRGEINYPDKIMTYWENCGFRRHLERDLFASSFDKAITQENSESEITIRYAETSDDTSFTKELIENTFDRYTGDILTYEETAAFVKKRNVLCACHKDTPAGILHFENKSGVIWIGHLAVAPGFRGKGIAKELVRSYINFNYTGEPTRYHLWVVKDNFSARRLYANFGFRYADKSTLSMLLI